VFEDKLSEVFRELNEYKVAFHSLIKLRGKLNYMKMK